MGVQEEVEKVVTENFPNHERDIGIKIHEAQKTQHKINTKITLRNIKVNSLNSNRKIWKQEEKRAISHTKLSVYFSE